MKKALALVLSAAMVVSMLTVNVFAATSNYIDKDFNVPKYSLFVEDQSLPANQVAISKSVPYATINGVATYVNDNDDNDLDYFDNDDYSDVEYVIDGGDLVISFNRTTSTLSGTPKFEVNLSGAYWYFAAYGKSYYKPENGAYEAASNKYFSNSITLTKAYARYASSVGVEVKDLADAIIGDADVIAAVAAYPKSGAGDPTDVINAIAALTSDKIAKALVANIGIAAIDDAIDDEDSRVIYTNPAFVSDTAILLQERNPNKGSYEVPYVLSVNTNDESKAVVYFDAKTLTNLTTVQDDVVIRIPLVIRTTDANTVYVNIVGGNQSTVTSQKILLAGSNKGTKSTSLAAPIEERDTFIIDGIRTKELVTHVFAGTQIMSYDLNDGFYFGGNTRDPFSSSDYYNVYIGEDTAWQDGTTGGYGVYEPAVYDIFTAAVNNYNKDLAANVKSMPSFEKYLEDNGYSDAITIVLNDSGLPEYGVTYAHTAPTANDKLAVGYDGLSEADLGSVWVWFGAIIPSTQLLSSIEFRDLPIYAYDDNEIFDQDVTITIDGYLADGTENITRETVKVGVRRDWDLMLKAITDPTTLVTGRYIGPSWDGLDADDATHMTADIRLQEASSLSWWGQRLTVLALPESSGDGKVLGAAFRKVEVLDTDNIAAYLGAIPEEFQAISKSVLYNANNPHHSTPLYDSYWTDSDGKVGGVYLNDGELHGNIKVDGNTITITRLQTSTNSKAKIDLRLWVSLELGLAAQENGELRIKIDTAKSTSIVDTGKEYSALIAHMYDPITVTTKVSDLKIGYQFQATQDITITENVPGALLKGKTVLVSISDLVGTDLIFSSDITITPNTADSGLEITNIKAVGQGGFTSQSKSTLDETDASGSIAFDISKAATKTAGTIVLSNVGVKLDRTAPVTNKEPYKVVVWGTAVAENYGLTDDKGREWKADFNTVGVITPYVQIVTSANDAASVLTQEVAVTIGQNYYIVNGKTYTLPTGAEPYQDANGNTMVPVRFVSRALGIADDAIVWDQANQVVTIFAPSKTVQFKVGEPAVSIDGVSIPSNGADGNPVAPTNRAPGYTFLPYRVLGQVFGITVDWDQATKTATYNKGANTNANLANTNTTQVN